MKCKRCGGRRFYVSHYDVVCLNCNLVVGQLNLNKPIELVENGVSLRNVAVEI